MPCRKTFTVNKITKKNEYKHTYDMSCVMRLTQNQKFQQTQYCSMVMLLKKIALCYALLHNFHM